MGSIGIGLVKGPHASTFGIVNTENMVIITKAVAKVSMSKGNSPIEDFMLSVFWTRYVYKDRWSFV